MVPFERMMLQPFIATPNIAIRTSTAGIIRQRGESRALFSQSIRASTQSVQRSMW